MRELRRSCEVGGEVEVERRRRQAPTDPTRWMTVTPPRTTVLHCMRPELGRQQHRRRSPPPPDWTACAHGGRRLGSLHRGGSHGASPPSFPCFSPAACTWRLPCSPRPPRRRPSLRGGRGRQGEAEVPTPGSAGGRGGWRRWRETRWGPGGGCHSASKESASNRVNGGERDVARFSQYPGGAKSTLNRYCRSRSGPHPVPVRIA
jgi:hypothetical protein